MPHIVMLLSHVQDQLLTKSSDILNKAKEENSARLRRTTEPVTKSFDIS